MEIAKALEDQSDEVDEERMALIEQSITSWSSAISAALEPRGKSEIHSKEALLLLQSLPISQPDREALLNLTIYWTNSDGACMLSIVQLVISADNFLAMSSVSCSRQILQL